MRALRLLTAALLSTALAAACATEEAPSVEAAAGSPSVEVGAVEPAVSVIATGHWNQIQGCSGFCVATYHFWVDLKVRNDGYHKDVGILWTDTGWASIKTANAVYEADLGDGWEQWGVDVVVGTMATYRRPDEIELAAYAAMAGQTHWDPKNNHYIYDKVTAEEPVKVLRSEVHAEPGLGVVMTGRVRVYDLAFDKQVTVVWSTDGWDTHHETEAYWAEQQEWDFRVENVADLPLPSEVAFAVRYISAGEEHWDNNNGGDYHHKLDPDFSTGYLLTDIETPLSGVYTLGGTFSTSLPLTSPKARVDDGAWTDGNRVTFSTLELTEGAHQVEVRVGLEGGGELSRFIHFTVDNRVTPVDRWTPTAGGGAALSDAWAMAVADDGTVYVGPGSSSGIPDEVLVYDAYGDAAPSATINLPDGMRSSSLSVDPSGRLYVVANTTQGKRLLRYGADGALDAGFGGAQGVDLEGQLAGQSLCYAGEVLGTAEAVYLVDTCNRRVIRFDLADGAAESAIAMPEGGTAIPAALYADEDGLWVGQSWRLVRITDDATAPMSVVETVAFDETYTNLAGLERAADGTFWMAYGHADVVAIDGAGAQVAHWYGDDNLSDFDGAFDLPQALEALPGGDVVVLGAAGPILARFSTVLAD